MPSWARHARFMVAFALGVAIASVATLLQLDPILRALLAVNGFFLSYLVLMVVLTVTTDGEGLRHHSEQDDEGMALILIIALGSVVISLGSVLLVLTNAAHSPTEAALGLTAVPLGWAMLHMLVAFHYAHLYYLPDPDDGLEFPGGPAAPEAWDFLYFSFTIGMTAQVSDVVVTNTRLRRAVLLHSMGSFFYNTVILALAVNAGLALSH